MYDFKPPTRNHKSQSFTLVTSFFQVKLDCNSYAYTYPKDPTHRPNHVLCDKIYIALLNIRANHI